MQHLKIIQEIILHWEKFLVQTNNSEAKINMNMIPVGCRMQIAYRSGWRLTIDANYQPCIAEDSHFMRRVEQFRF